MTEDINNYSFSFEKEVNGLRHSGGGPAEDILFLDLDFTGYGVRLLQKTGPDNGLADSVLKKARYDYFHFNKTGSRSLKWEAFDPEHPGKHTFRTVLFNGNDSFSGRLGEKNKPLMNLFALYHEAGHMLAGYTPETGEKRPVAENIADAYAAIRFFQKFGQEAAPFLSAIAGMRASQALTGSKTHLSTTVLDRIIADSGHIDFSKLAPAETIKRAETYAAEWTPVSHRLSGVKAVFAHARQKNPGPHKKSSAKRISRP